MRLLALVLACALAVPGCSWFESNAKTAEQALIDCGKQDLGQLVGDQGLTLLGDVAQLIAAGGDGWQDALSKLALTVGDDALACAVKAVSTVFASAPTGQQTTHESEAAMRASSTISKHGWRFVK